MSEKKDKETGKDKVYFDGDCPMCRQFVPMIESEEETAISFNNLREQPLPEGVSIEQASEKIHLELADGTIVKGASAVFHMLEQNNKYTWLAKIGRLPVISIIAEVVYSIIANHRFLLFGSYQRLFWSKIVLCISFLIPFFITKNLWLSTTFRSYPLTPVSELLPTIAYPLDVIIFSILALQLFVILIVKKAKTWIRVFIISVVAYSIFDQSRWLPYYYQFTAMFLGMWFLCWDIKKEEDREKENAIAILAIVLFSIWFWSGIHKINFRYLFVGFPWMITPLTQHLSEGTNQILNNCGFISPLIETGGAIMLLFKRTRALAVLLLSGMHIMILMFFGPLGLDVNYSVWSWNLAQIALLWLVFWKNDSISARLVFLGKSTIHKIIMIMFFILPCLNYVGLWDDFLSHALYSWTTKEAEIIVEDSQTEQELPPNARKAIVEHNDVRFVHVLNWTYIEFESPPYHSFRVFKKVFESLCETVSDKSKLELVIFDNPPILSTRSQKHKFTCDIFAKKN